MNGLPFSRQQLFETFAAYNGDLWPLQVALFLLAVSALFAMVARRPGSDKVVSLILAALWVWMGVVFHFTYFTEVTPAAWLFGAACLLGAAAFVRAGVLHRRLRFNSEARWRRIAGHALILYALVVYPLLSLLLGRAYPALPTFGAPCPTTIFTIGMLAFATAPFPRYVLVVPVAWALIGGQAAYQLGMYEDFGLLAAGVAGAWLAFDAPPRTRRA